MVSYCTAHIQKSLQHLRNCMIWTAQFTVLYVSLCTKGYMVTCTSHDYLHPTEPGVTLVTC